MENLVEAGGVQVLSDDCVVATAVCEHSKYHVFIKIKKG